MIRRARRNDLSKNKILTDKIKRIYGYKRKNYRDQAISIQETLQTVYAGVSGEYYFEDGAWDFIKKETGVDLLKILEEIANNKTKE